MIVVGARWSLLRYFMRSLDQRPS